MERRIRDEALAKVLGAPLALESSNSIFAVGREQKKQ
jgi:hypothetical protein